jgi:hypothetical protein
VPQGVSRRSFRGGVVSSEGVVGVFWDVICIGDHSIELRPLGRRDLVLHRDEVEAVEFERQWAPPFWVKTVIRFRFDDGAYAPKVVVAIQTRAVRAALTEFGWPVTRVQFGSSEPRTVRPPREPRGQGS